MAIDDYDTVDEQSGTPDISLAEEDVYRILDDNGAVLPEASVPDVSDDTFLDMYADLKRARMFDEKMMNLAYSGRIENYAPMSGHDAAQVASLYAINEDDMVFPTYREEASKMLRLGMENLLTELSGYEEGITEEDVPIFPTAVPIATQLPHATGWAWAADMNDDDRIALAYLGDGATSEGDFHEGLNFAGVFDTPTVFLCQNNQYAISVPREQQTAADTIAQKAVAYGFEGIHIDGMDPLAVYETVHAAAEKARTADDTALEEHLPIDGQKDHAFLHNQGVERSPTLIEADLYRFGPHTTSDDPSLYRRQEEEGAWNDKDPIPRMERFLRDQGLLDDEQIDAMETAIEDEISEAIDAVEQLPEPDPEDMFRYVYDEMPDRLLQQYREHFGDG